MFGLEPADVMRDSALLSSRVPTSELQTAWSICSLRRLWANRGTSVSNSATGRCAAVVLGRRDVGADRIGYLRVARSRVGYHRGGRARESAQGEDASVFESTHDGVVIMDPKGLAINVNPAFVTLTGSTNDMRGQPARLVGGLD